MDFAGNPGSCKIKGFRGSPAVAWLSQCRGSSPLVREVPLARDNRACFLLRSLLGSRRPPILGLDSVLNYNSLSLILSFVGT